MDQDYINDLSDEEKDWLNDFNEEYYGANLDFQNLDNNRFHKTAEQKKDCTDRNNARNRCQYGIAKATGMVDKPPLRKDDSQIPKNPGDQERDTRRHLSSDNPEDALIELIDSKKVTS